MKHFHWNTCLLAAILTAPVWTAVPAVAQSGASCVVDNTLDSALGSPPLAGSLRDCLTRVVPNDSIIFDPVVFDLSNSDAATIINVLYELPPLDDGSVTIDASDRRVTINGSGANSASGISITSSSNRVMGLSLVGFTGSGVALQSGTANVIGGPRTTGVGPNGQGLRLSGNGAFGIEISGAGTDNNVVKGCWIGLDASGNAPQANLRGLVIQGGAQHNTIGGALAGEANVIGGNTLEGLTIADVGTDDNVVIGNVIGASASGNDIASRSAVANGSAGLFLSRGTQGSQVGGNNAGESNTVAFNGGTGIEVRAANSRRNAARNNRIGRNVGGGITLFDGSNDGVRPPVIVSVQHLGPNAMGTASTLRMTGTTPEDGSIEIFNDTGSQGETFVGRTDGLAGVWTADVDVSEIDNLTATLTDSLGNTSRFGVFGLTSLDTDDDGVSDVLEGLAGTDPGNMLDTPELAGALDPSKLSIKLNFANPGKDSLKMTTTLVLPSGFVSNGATLGVFVAGHFEEFVLDENGKASSPNGSVSLKISANTGPVVKYGIKASSLQSILASSGLIDETTPQEGKSWVLPVAVTTGDSVQFGSFTVLYKAKAGKTGKAK